jgi:hypothetical protein
MHSGSPALPGRSPKFTKLQPDYANFRKSSSRIRNQLDPDPKKMLSGSPALPGRSPKCKKLQQDYANFRKSSCRIRNQLKSRIRIRKKCIPDPQHCREGQQNLQNYTRLYLGAELLELLLQLLLSAPAHHGLRVGDAPRETRVRQL